MLQLTRLITICTFLLAVSANITLYAQSNITHLRGTDKALGDTVLFSDDFESYEYGSQDLSAWTQFDGDAAANACGYVGAFSIKENAHSGSKALVSCYNYNQSTNNDWVITPKLNIKYTGYKIRFWAQSSSPQWLESFEVGVSEGSNDVSNFIMLREENNQSTTDIPAEWVQYTYNLSAYKGKDIYIAIHHYSTDKLFFLIDDFSVLRTATEVVSTSVSASKITLYFSRDIDVNIPSMPFDVFNINTNSIYSGTYKLTSPNAITFTPSSPLSPQVIGVTLNSTLDSDLLPISSYSSEFTIVPDIVKVLPKNNKNNVKDSIIQIKLNGLVDAASINSSTFIVSGSQHGIYSGTYKTTGTKTDSVTFVSNQRFGKGDVITVTLISNLATNQIFADHQYQFRMATTPNLASFSTRQQVINNNAISANCVYAADIDGDDDLDVLSASYDDNTIAWYKNTDGEGTFAKKNISVNAKGATSVYAADIDGDGDMDVLSASSTDNKIAWYRNKDGKGSFAEQTISTNADSALSVYAADIDGDGDMDVLSASYDDNKIAWYNNTDGKGTFAIEKIISTNANGAFSVYAADIDGDGDMDVLSASADDNKIAWYENTDGKGAFAEKIISTNAAGASSVYAADIDADGDMDVLSASYDDDKIAWYENTDGKGSFTPRTISTNAAGASSVYAADIDGDGDLDVLSASYDDDKIAWYENTDGKGTYIPRTIFTNAAGASSVYATDMDGDGDLDILLSSYDDNKIVWYRNAVFVKTASPAPNSTIAVGTKPNITITLSNEIDTLTVTDSSFQLKGSNSGIVAGTFSFNKAKTITFSPLEPFIASETFTVTLSTVAVGDTILDTYSLPIAAYTYQFAAPPTIASVLPKPNEGNVLINSNIKIKLTSMVDAANIDFSTFIVSGSINGIYKGTYKTNTPTTDTVTFLADKPFAKGEIITVTLTSNVRTNKLFADYQYQFTVETTPNFADFSGQTRVISDTANGASSVYATDIDGDGDMDVLSASQLDNKISWYNNTNGKGTFTEDTISTNAKKARSVYAADIDADGDLDVLSASSGDNNIAWYNNEGKGVFTKNNISTTAYGASSVYAADIDGDGDMDVLSASETDNKIAWYKNTDGKGKFALQVISGNAKGASSVYAADIDGDGNMDILSASATDNKIAWYKNDGYGKFTAQDISTTVYGASSVYATDIDNDRDMDILSASATDNKIVWYKNDGYGKFTAQDISTNAKGANSVYAADIDGDGDMDVLSASETDNKIAWYENTDGKGTFTAQTISTNAKGASSGYAADIDGDGDLDVLSASATDNKIAWYRNAVFTTSTSPAPNSFTDAAVSKNISINFSNDIKFSSVTTSNFEVKNSALATIAGTFSQNNGQNIVFTPTTALSTDVYTVTLTSNILDTYSLPIEAYDYRFAIVPTIISVLPEPNSDYVDTNSVVQVKLGGVIDATTIGASTFIVSGSQHGIYKGVYNKKIGDTSTVTFVPDKPFAPGEVITVILTSNFDTKQIFADYQYQFTVAVARNFADFLSGQKIISTNANNARSVYAADIDGDGDLDVLSASLLDNKIAWYENTDGQGTFITEQVISTTAKGATSVYTADIDGDGDMDVLSASQGDNKIAWYKNTNGKGTFTSEQVISTTAKGATSVYAADIDGDGDLDVLSASSSDDKIAWYQNTDGKGIFAEKIISTNADGARSVYAADMDGDGDMDVLSASWNDDKIAWYKNTNGKGTFTSEQVISTTAKGATSVYAADIDGDGDLDVLSASGSNDKIAWYKNRDGKGTFTSEQVISTNADFAYSVYACDIDGDSDIDVLSASIYDNKIAWYINTDGKGKFTSERIISTNLRAAASVFAGDIDGDGDLDVLSAYIYNNTIAWYENGTTIKQISPAANSINITAGSAITLTTSQPIDKNSLDTSSFVLWGAQTGVYNGTYAVNKDTIVTFTPANHFKAGEIISLTLTTNIQDTNRLPIAQNTQVQFTVAATVAHKASFPEKINISSKAQAASSVYAADIDGDGDVDVLSAFPYDKKIAWFNNVDGQGTFAAEQVISTNANNAHSVYAADIDGDGDLDVLSASVSDNKIAWYENTDRKGTFTTEQIISDTANGVSSVYAADIDGDGDMDVLSASFSEIAWYENTDGKGTFTPRTISTNSLGATSVYAADMDNDGDVDVLSTSEFDNKTAWYENNDGKGTFTSEQVISTNANVPYSIYAADIDGDGDMDALSASFSDNKIAWYENAFDIIGSAQFSKQKIISTNAKSAKSVYAADMDGDGDMDVLSASQTDNKIAWYENTDGKGTFVETQVISNNAYSASSVYASDIDGDGDLDVLSASYGGNKIVWYKNQKRLQIEKQPQNTDFCEGDTLQLYITANGEGGIKYKWQQSNQSDTGFVDITTGGNISLISDTLLQIVKADKTLDGKYYMCVVKDTNKTDTSDVIQVRLKAVKTEFVAQPDNASVVSGQLASFSVTANGENNTYQWQKRDNTSSWNNINSANRTTYPLVADSTAQGTYRCIATGVCGIDSSSAATFLLPPGNTLKLDGVDDYVAVPNESNFDFTNALTIEAWIKVNKFDIPSQTIVSKGQSWSLALEHYQNSDVLAFHINDTLFRVTTYINDGKWHHVATVFNGIMLYIYVDGKPVYGMYYDSPIGTNDIEVQIGRNWNGAIDELRIWNTERSLIQIQANMHNMLTGNENGLVAYYRFDQFDGTTVPDTKKAQNGEVKNESTPAWEKSGAFVPIILSQPISESRNTGESINFNVEAAVGYGGTYQWYKNDVALPNTNKPQYEIKNITTPDYAQYYCKVSNLYGTIQTDSVRLFAPPGNCLEFPGIVYIPTNNYISSNLLTIEAWIQADTSKKDFSIVSKKLGNQGYQLLLNSNKQIVFEIGTGNEYVQLTSDRKIDAEWTHVAGVYNGKTMEIFINSNPVIQKEVSFQFTDNQPYLFIGVEILEDMNFDNFFNGKIDEVRIWERDLSQEYIREQMTRVLSGNESGLVAYYKFDEIQGLILPDKSKNQNNGYIDGMSTARPWVKSGAFEIKISPPKIEIPTPYCIGDTVIILRDTSAVDGVTYWSENKSNFSIKGSQWLYHIPRGVDSTTVYALKKFNNTNLSADTARITLIIRPTIEKSGANLHLNTYRVKNVTIEWFYSTDSITWAKHSDTVATIAYTMENYYYARVHNGACAANSRVYHVVNKKSQPLNNSADNIELYPNPANNKLYLRYINTTATSSNVKITDVGGRVVWEQQVFLSDTETSIDVSTLHQGLYFVYIFTPDTSVAKSLLISKQ